MLNNISNVSAYSRLPQKLTKKTLVNKMYKASRAQSAISKFALGACAVGVMSTLCNFSIPVIVGTLSCALSGYLGRDDMKNTKMLRNAYKEIVERAKTMKR